MDFTWGYSGERHMIPMVEQYEHFDLTLFRFDPAGFPGRPLSISDHGTAAPTAVDTSPGPDGAKASKADRP